MSGCLSTLLRLIWDQLLDIMKFKGFMIAVLNGHDTSFQGIFFFFLLSVVVRFSFCFIESTYFSNDSAYATANKFMLACYKNGNC
jgi:hypothetical protein